MNFEDRAICERLRSVRLEKFGPRGKAQFAKCLGIRPSTYQQYELTRIPPVDLLVRAAALTHSDLLWLLVGDIARKPSTRGEREHAVVERVRELLDRRPDAAVSLSAFLTLIDPTGPPATEPEIGGARQKTETPPMPGSTKQMVPVVGSTAAGPARFWRELLDGRERKEDWGAEANVRLEQLLKQCTQRGRSSSGQSTSGRLVRDAADPRPDSTAALIQFSRPDELGLVEFLSCPGLEEGPSPLVAWRIDGDSMMPRYRDGDFVLVSPNQPAAEGLPCVAHQRGQIGVNCKIFKKDGSDIVLIPVNEAFASQRFPASQLAWAQRVLFSVRLKPHQSR